MTDTATTTTRPDELDPFRPEHLEDPYPLYADLRGRGPAVHLPERDVWLVSRYDAVDAVLRDYKHFLSGLGTSYTRVAESGFRFPFIDNDPPEHSRVRRAAQPWFTRSATADLQPAVAEIVAGLVEPALGAGSMDVVTTLAQPLPDLTIRRVTGIVPPDGPTMARWADATFHVLGPEPDPRHLELTLQALTWLGTEGAPAMPPHCLGHALLQDGGANGGLHEGEERLLALASIWVAGVDTTTALIANTVHAFARHPEQWAALRADRSLIPAAVEEVLRWDSPIKMFMRRTGSEPVDLLGTTIPADADVVALFPAANRDPEVFADAEAFDITAPRPRGHVAFGASVHLCIGAPVARLELTELLGALADRVERFELDGDPVRSPSRVIRGFTSLPVRLVTA